MMKPLLLCTVFALSACATQTPPAPPPEPERVETKPLQGDQYWTLNFFYFYKSKQTHSNSFQYVNRRDCFEAMYQMQVDSKKKAGHSGAGVCSKLFVDGQKRTADDLLGFR
jgi:hypothetical protein